MHFMILGREAVGVDYAPTGRNELNMLARSLRRGNCQVGLFMQMGKKRMGSFLNS